MRPARMGAALVGLVLVAGLSACSGGAGTPSEPATPSLTAHRTPSPAKVSLSLGVWGASDEVASYQSLVDTYNSLSTNAHVTVRTFADDSAVEQAVNQDQAPDVFLVTRADLAGLLAHRQTTPLGDLLDDRGVDFGDDYSRTALEAFSADRDLQCMPWGISPQVLFYNRALVDFDQMAARGLDVPSGSQSTWTFDQFRTAAEFAAHPRRGIASIYVEPSLRGIAPWLDTAGGDLFDNDTQPTSLDLSSAANQTALRTVLPVLTDPRLTLTAAQLAQQSPLQWFEAGKLAMLPGYRSMVPELRQHAALDWDVITIPNAGTLTTDGDLTALCVSSATKNTGDAADLLADLISSDSEAQVASAGYLAPANSTVALSSDFLQPGRAPEHASVFNGAVRSIRLFPLFDDYSGVSTAEAPLLTQLLEPGGRPDLATLARSIDDISLPYFSPTSASASPDG